MFVNLFLYCTINIAFLRNSCVAHIINTFDDVIVLNWLHHILIIIFRCQNVQMCIRPYQQLAEWFKILGNSIVQEIGEYVLPSITKLKLDNWEKCWGLFLGWSPVWVARIRCYQLSRPVGQVDKGLGGQMLRLAPRPCCQGQHPWSAITSWGSYNSCWLQVLVAWAECKGCLPPTLFK